MSDQTEHILYITYFANNFTAVKAEMIGMDTYGRLTKILTYEINFH